MKKLLSFILLLTVTEQSNATNKDSTVNYLLPDSVRAIQFMAEINIQSISGKKEIYAGIRTDVVSLSIESGKEDREISFDFPAGSAIITKGMDAEADKKEIEWKYNWSLNENYKLMIAVASDSAGNFSLYSGYIFLPKENKWKLIGTCKIAGRWTTLKQPAVFYSPGKKRSISFITGQVWCQRSNGSWKNMKEGILPSPTVNLFAHIDSVQQRQIDIKLIEEAIASGKTDAKQNEAAVYYTMMKEGAGKQVSVNDTVVAYYKGYLFENGQVFDETKDKPATFPLKRLIRGWQIGVPLCKVGGKIKLVIPSDLAYSIRTRAAKIPPNSILVFEIEVVDVRSPL